MTSSRRARRALGALCLAACALSLSAPSRAEPKDATSIGTARDLYNEGLALRDKGELRGAIEKFKAAHALARTPITGLELAKTHAALGELLEAREICLGIGRTPVSPEETPRSADARRDAAKLAEDIAPKIASLKVVITGVPAGVLAHLTIDGGEIPAVAITATQRVNPGPHDIVARAGKGKETKVSVDLAYGESKSVELKVEPPPPDADPGPGPGGGSREKKSSSLVPIGGAIALTGLTVGSIAGLIAFSHKTDLDSACPGGRCPESERDNLSTAKAMGTVSTVAFVVGVAGGAVLVYGLVSPPASQQGKNGATIAAAVGPGSVGIHGRF